MDRTLFLAAMHLALTVVDGREVKGLRGHPRKDVSGSTKRLPL